jgi:glyoxylase-like metal-dependent hydrolase (beta-lactamase superfamily II)
MVVSNYRHAIHNHSLNETAHEQIQQLGYKSEDVRHIAITHMHLDHVGGITDFPNAKIHIFDQEFEAITRPRTLEERFVCRREHWAHDPNWIIHELEGDKWFGFDCTSPFELGDTEFRFVPLTGHTRGHSAVAVRSQDSWLLHCGDAYVHHGDVKPDGPIYPPKYKITLDILGLFSHAFRVLGVHSSKLRRLLRDHGDEVHIFCSHDPLEFARFHSDYKYSLYQE